MHTALTKLLHNIAKAYFKQVQNIGSRINKHGQLSPKLASLVSKVAILLCIYVLSVICALFFFFTSQYELVAIFAVIVAISLYIQSRITKDFNAHHNQINKLRKTYNSFNKYPSPFWRGVKVVCFGLLSVGLLYALGEFSSIENTFSLLKPSKNDTSGSFIKIQYLIITAPIIYIIWAFRDHNKLIELENARKDTNLKEFQQLQQWATGNIPNDGDDEQKTSLQISALHSLRPYLRGEYGQSFRRGAYEIFRSTLETQHSKVLEKLEKEEDLTIERAINQDQLTKQLNIIASEEWFNLLINHDFPLGDISLVGVDLSGTKDKLKYLQHQRFGESLNLKGAKLAFANLSYVNLSGADLRGIKAQGINLSDSDLSNCDLSPIPQTHADKVSAMLKDKQ